MTTNEPSIQFAKNLNELMTAQNLTLETLAAKLSICKSSLHNYCNGVQPRNLQTIIKIADFFKISINDLIFERKIENLDSIFKSNNLEGEYLVKVEKRRG